VSAMSASARCTNFGARRFAGEPQWDELRTAEVAAHTWSNGRRGMRRIFATAMCVAKAGELMLRSCLPAARSRARSVVTPWCRLIRAMAIILLGSALSGCLSSLQGGPDRLYTAQEETDAARQELPDLVANYYASGEPAKTGYRNEVMGQRLHVIDVQFSQYDEALTKESQEVGFAADATSVGLNTAGTLFTSAQTTKILGGIAGSVTGVKGAYQSDIVIAKTIQIIQAQMQSNRDQVLTRILKRMSENSTNYPLSVALSDLEDYYRAGTFTEGLIQTSGNVSTGAKTAQDKKDQVATIIYSAKFSTDTSTTTLVNYLYPQGVKGPIDRAKEAKLNALLADPTKFPQVNGAPWIVQQILFGAGTAPIRSNLVRAAGLM
jgi:hypothetical protein